MRYLLTIALLLFSFHAFSATNADDDTVQVGNKLFLYIPGEVDFDKTFEVDNKGQINLPEVGQFVVANKTISQVELELTPVLGGLFVAMDDFYVEIRSRDIFINVMGYVNTPSQVSIPADGNIQMVISKADGLRPGAQLDRLQIRRGEEIIEFDYKE